MAQTMPIKRFLTNIFLWEHEPWAEGRYITRESPPRSGLQEPPANPVIWIHGRLCNWMDGRPAPIWHPWGG